MSWWVYVLECRDGTLYTGCTDDIPRRLEAHNAGRGAKYTRGRGPVTMRYREETLDKPAGGDAAGADRLQQRCPTAANA